VCAFFPLPLIPNKDSSPPPRGVFCRSADSRKRKSEENKKAEAKKLEEESQEEEELPLKLPRLEEAKTPAERRFEEMQRQREEQEAKKLSLKSHRERVEEFNSKLDKLPTHFDIPKVGPG